MDKRVGVVVPIYNVSKYLEQCLKSISSQSYEALEIILVDDGSTDESFELAKKYLLKDERMSLIRKTNAGQGSAKNVGIEYLSLELKFSFDEDLKEGLKSYKPLGQNRYGIEKLYKKREQEPAPVDYLIFIDSDDFWKQDLISSYVALMLEYRPHILWADYEFYYDGVSNLGLKSNFENFKLTKQGLISIDEWEELVSKVKSCPFTWQGMLDFKFFMSLKLRFLERTSGEDLHFGALLFSQSEKIFVLQKKLYNYRIRSDSTCSYNETYFSLPSYLASLYELCEKNIELTKKYNSFHNYFKISSSLIEFFHSSENERAKKIIREVFIPTYVKRFRGIFELDIDPLNLKEQYPKIRPYLSYIDAEGAVLKAQNHLSFKIGSLLLEYKKASLNTKDLFFKILGVFLKHYLLTKTLKFFKKSYPLEAYKDYEQALEIQNTQGYKLGGAFLQTPFFKLKEFLKKIKEEK